jgi:hypothetical protein
MDYEVGETQFGERDLDRGLQTPQYILENSGVEYDLDEDAVFDTERRDTYVDEDGRTVYGTDDLRMMVHNEMREPIETIAANSARFPKVSHQIMCSRTPPPHAHTVVGVPRERSEEDDAEAKRMLGDEFEKSAVQRIMDGDGKYTTGRDSRIIGPEYIEGVLGELIDEFTPAADGDIVIELEENWEETMEKETAPDQTPRLEENKRY